MCVLGLAGERVGEGDAVLRKPVYNAMKLALGDTKIKQIRVNVCLETPNVRGCFRVVDDRVSQRRVKLEHNGHIIPEKVPHGLAHTQTTAVHRAVRLAGGAPVLDQMQFGGRPARKLDHRRVGHHHVLVNNSQRGLDGPDAQDIIRWHTLAALRALLLQILVLAFVLPAFAHARLVARNVRAIALPRWFPNLRRLVTNQAR